MDGMISVKDASKRWNMSTMKIARLCRQGKVSGAVKDGMSWLIPVTAERPEDAVSVSEGAGGADRDTSFDFDRHCNG